MNQQSSNNFKGSNAKKLIFMSMVVVLSSLTLMTLTMIASADAAPRLPYTTPLNCDRVDDSSYGECDQDVVFTDGSFDDCFFNGATNCETSQTVSVNNVLRNSANEAKIYQLINSLVDCDEDADYCLARTLNDGSQSVVVQGYRESTTGVRADVDIDTDQKLTQRIETDGAETDNFYSQNRASQEFTAIAKPSTGASSSNTATVDADGDDAHVDQYATQDNIDCDGVECFNEGFQSYYLEANGKSSVIATDNQGLELIQKNERCTDSNTPTSTTTNMDCINDASQIVQLVAGTIPSTSTSTPPNDDAKITFDTTGNMLVDQYNNCDDGRLDCVNNADTLVQAYAQGTSSMNFDETEQNVDQFSNCNDLVVATRITTIGCGNEADVVLQAYSNSDGIINVREGDQDVNQYNDCTGAACDNAATLFVGFGTSTNPVDGTITADYSQLADQTNRCVGEGETECENQAQIVYTISSDGSAKVTSTSDQTVTQINECGWYEEQGCTNIAFLNNYIEAANSATVDSTVTQNLYQSCGPDDGLICTNTNDMTVDASAIGSSFLRYTATQDVENIGDDNSGTSTIYYTTDTTSGNAFPSTLTPSPYTQTSGNAQKCFPNTPCPPPR